MMNKLAISSLISLVLIYSAQAHADSKSVGNSKQLWQQNVALTKLKTLATTEDNINNNKLGKIRAELIAQKQQNFPAKQTALAKDKQRSSAIFHHEFNIYRGYAQLIEDYDEDGFYQTFSVTFDADVYSHDIVDQAVVYAELYLSKDGGDWVHYFTTDDFVIYGESEDDEYEVYTTLNQGYVPAHYDVLIDLYEVGYSDIVATYSSDNTNELYALPLESSDYDPDYVKHASHSHGHGGSLSMAFLLGLTLLGARKYLSLADS